MLKDLLTKDIIIFGASKAGEKAYRTLIELDNDINIMFFMDNNSAKWGKIFCGITVCDPQYMLEMDIDRSLIVIASMYIGEIIEQLDEMGLDGHYIDISELIFEIAKEKEIVQIVNGNPARLNNSYKKSLYFISLPRGMALGGLEIWSLTVARLLAEYKKDVSLLSLSNDESTSCISSDFNILDFSQKEMNYLSYLNWLILDIDKYSPNVLIPNVSEDIYLAGYFMKKILKRKIKIISILHSDIEFSYLQNSRYEDIIDKFICVSEEIRNNLIKKLPHREKDIYALITPVQSINFSRQYSPNTKPVKIGYVGRLVKPDKRADYLFELIDQLEKKSVNYQFNIVGEGEYFDKLYEFIIAKSLDSKIKLVNGLPNDQIYKFWQDKDIFVNVSDREGTSISMLEGLYNGAVPVLTDVSGVRKFVSHGENGFIVNIGDIDDMAKKIKYLDDHRELLPLYGENIHRRVADICDPDHFIRRFIEICEN